MYQKFKIALFALLCIVTLMSFHPFHFSVTEIKYNHKTHTMEVSTRLFINDFEAILKKKYGVTCDLYKQAEDENVKKAVATYIQEHLQIKSGHKTIALQLLGAEREDDALWVFLESGIVPTPYQTTIHNTLLFDWFDDQSNIVHFEINGQRKSQKLTNSNSTWQVN